MSLFLNRRLRPVARSAELALPGCIHDLFGISDGSQCLDQYYFVRSAFGWKNKCRARVDGLYIIGANGIGA